VCVCVCVCVSFVCVCVCVCVTPVCDIQERHGESAAAYRQLLAASIQCHPYDAALTSAHDTLLFFEHVPQKIHELARLAKAVRSVHREGGPGVWEDARNREEDRQDRTRSARALGYGAEFVATSLPLEPNFRCNLLCLISPYLTFPSLTLSHLT